MFSKKIFLLSILLIIAIGTVSTVCADEVTNDTISYASNEIEMDGNSEIDVETNDDTLGHVNDESEDDLGVSDDENVVSDDGIKSFGYLQAQIKNVFDGGTLSLNYDYCWDDSFDGDGIFIEKSITINGNGHVINALEQSRIFLIYADNVVINNLSFIGGYGDSTGGGSGGAICTFNNVTTLNDCFFWNCSTVKNGGAIATTGFLKIKDSYFYNCHAEQDGGAIYAYYPSRGEKALSIYDSYFMDNSADRYGGALYLNYHTVRGLVGMDSPADTYIKNSVFTHNQAQYGGVIFNSHDLDIVDSNFFYNAVSGGGGAIYMSAGVILTDNDEIVLAYPISLKIHGNSIFANNVADYYGGAIRIGTSDACIAAGIKGILRVYDDVLFLANYGDGPGGAVSLVEADATIKNARFINNTGNEGSAIYGGTAINCVFEGNDAPATYDTKIVTTSASKLSVSQRGSTFGDKTISIKLTNAKNGAAVKNTKVTIRIAGNLFSLKTGSNGVATFKVPCSPGTYMAVVNFAGNDYYSASTSKVKVVVNKASSKITAKKATFKVKKTKKYSITLKDGKGKAVKKVNVFLKVKGKTFKAKTNSNGKATFKVKLTRIGSIKAVINFAGNTNYKSSSKKVSFVVKK